MRKSSPGNFFLPMVAIFCTMIVLICIISFTTAAPSLTTSFKLEYPSLSLDTISSSPFANDQSIYIIEFTPHTAYKYISQFSSHHVALMNSRSLLIHGTGMSIFEKINQLIDLNVDDISYIHPLQGDMKYVGPVVDFFANEFSTYSFESNSSPLSELDMLIPKEIKLGKKTDLKALKSSTTMTPLEIESFFSPLIVPFSELIGEYTSAAEYRFTGMAIAPHSSPQTLTNSQNLSHVSSHFSTIATSLQQTHIHEINAFETFLTADSHNQCQMFANSPQLDTTQRTLFTNFAQFFAHNDISPAKFFTAQDRIAATLFPFESINFNEDKQTPSVGANLRSHIPLHHFFTHGTVPETTTPTSDLTLSYFTFHLQSPLFLLQPSDFNNLIASRVDSIYKALATSSCGQSQPCPNSIENNNIFESLLHDLTLSSTSSSILPTQIQFDSFIKQFGLFYGDLDNENKKNTNQVLSLHKKNVLLLAQTPLFMNIAKVSSLQHQLYRHVDFTILSFIQSLISSPSSSLSSSSLSFSTLSLTTLAQNYLAQQIKQTHHSAQSLITTLSSSPIVFHIEIELQYSLQNYDTRFITTIGSDQIPLGASKPPSMSQYGPYAELGITGQGVVIGISDSGLDSGSCFFYDDEVGPFPFTGSIGVNSDSKHRKVKSYFVFGDDVDNSSHGSHVGGSVAGKCIDPIYKPTSSIVDGLSFDAKIAFQDIYGTKFATPENYSVLWQHALSNGAHISSNSWGCVSGYKGTNICQSATSRGFQTDKFLTENQELLVLIAAANYGTDAFETIGGLAIAKNTFSVGAGMSSHAAAARYDITAPRSPAFISTPNMFDPLHVVASFSNKGPSIDGRIKPDIIAPGSAIFSAMNDFGTRGGFVHGMDGTSMATPVLAGSLGLVQQMLQEGRINSGAPDLEQQIPKITGPLLKALAINGAQPMDFVNSEAVIAFPMPMKVQLLKDQPDIVVNGVSYVYVNMGLDQDEISMPEINGEVHFYSKASVVDPSYSSADLKNRVIGIMTKMVCVATLHLSVYLNDDDKWTLLDEIYFVPQTVDAPQRVTGFFTIPVNSNIFFSFRRAEDEQDEEPACVPEQDVFTWVVHEYSHSSLDDSLHYQEVSCTDSANHFPTQSAARQDWISEFYTVFLCPPISQCVNYIEAKVQGNHYYHIASSICRAAIHNNSFNMTQTGDASIDNRRQFVTTAFADYPGNEPVILGTERNGVTSNNQVNPIPGGLPYMVPSVSGQHIILPNGRENRLMNLLRIPHGPNGVSGYGLFQLSSILPLSNYSVAHRGKFDFSAERRVGIFSSGQDYNLINQKESVSHCFMISPKELRNIYSYPYFDTDLEQQVSSSSWNSGPDNIRVSLSWYDQASLPSTIKTDRLLVNDLNLHLFSPDGSEYRGNARADHRNTNERIELLPGTFMPGMYCAVVHGVNVIAPSYGQSFALVGNGRGLEKCLENPFPWDHPSKNDRSRDTISGQWLQSSSTCDQTTTNNVDLALFHKNQLLTIRQGGNCFTMHTPIDKYNHLGSSWVKEETYNFRGMRLSNSEHERNANWDLDESHMGQAQILSNNLFSLSGTILRNGTMNGFYYQSKTDTSPVYNFHVTGIYHEGYSINISLKSPTQTCHYSFQRQFTYSEVQYEHNEIDTYPEPSLATVFSASFALFISISSLFFFTSF